MVGVRPAFVSLGIVLDLESVARLAVAASDFLPLPSPTTESPACPEVLRITRHTH